MTTSTKGIIKEVIPITNDIKEYIIIPDRYARFEPGQFLQLAFGQVKPYDIWPDSRAFSIASPYDINKKELRIIVKRGTSFTYKIIEELQLGDIVTLRYPLGDFYLEDDTDNLVFIAAGTGITPFLSYLNSSKEKVYKGNVFLFYSAKNQNELIHYSNLVAHEKANIKFKLNTFLTREKVEGKDFIDNRITSKDIVCVVSNPKEAKIYICGPTQFIESITDQLKKEGIYNVYSEIWD